MKKIKVVKVVVSFLLAFALYHSALSVSQPTTGISARNIEPSPILKILDYTFMSLVLTCTVMWWLNPNKWTKITFAVSAIGGLILVMTSLYHNF